jgi:tetratricopeptide (TPR) repeat protein
MEFRYSGTLVSKNVLPSGSVLNTPNLSLSLKGSKPEIRYFVFIPMIPVDGSIDTEVTFTLNGSKVLSVPIKDDRLHYIQFPDVWSDKDNNLEIDCPESNETWRLSMIQCWDEIDGNPPDLNNHSTLLEIAEEFHQAGSHLELEKIADICLENDATKAEGHLILGYLYEVRRRYSEALQCYEKAVETNPEHTTARRYLAYVTASVGNFEKSKELLENLLLDVVDEYDLLLAWQYYSIILISEDKITELRERLGKLDSKNGRYTFHIQYIWKIVLQGILEGNTEHLLKGKLQPAMVRDIEIFSAAFAQSAIETGKIDRFQRLSQLSAICQLINS